MPTKCLSPSETPRRSTRPFRARARFVASAAALLAPAAALLALAPASLAAASHTRSGATPAPHLGIVAPSPAVPGLPLYLTGSALPAGGVRAVRFVEQPSSGQRGTRPAVAVLTDRTGAIRTAKPGTQLVVRLPSLSPGRWLVSIELSGRGRQTDAVALRVLAPSALHPGERCPSEWLDLSVGTLACGHSTSGLRWQTAAPSAAASSTTTTLAATPTAPGGGSPSTTTAPPSTTDSTTAPAAAASTTTTTQATATASSPGTLSVTVSVSGDPSRGAAIGALQAMVSRGGARMWPPAGAITFDLASLDPQQSAGTLELTTERPGQSSCFIDYSQMYVEQEDPSALGAPDGWHGEASGGGDCSATDVVPGSGGTPATWGSGTGRQVAQPFLQGIAVTAVYHGSSQVSSAADDVRFTGPSNVATVLAAARASQPGCFAANCLLVWPISPSYVGEVIAGTLVVSSFGGATCPASQLYDGPIPGVGAAPSATVAVPAGCDALMASYVPSPAAVTGEGGEAITYRPYPATPFPFAGGTVVTLGAGSTESYPPTLP